MKRDDDFIRELLLEAEASSEPYFLAPLTMGPSDEDLKRHLHCEWLQDAGFFMSVGKHGGVYRITNQGHDYLAAIRDDGIWKKTKEGAAKVGGVSLGIMGELAIAYVKQKLTAVTGLTL